VATGAVGIGAPAAFGLLVLTESGFPVPIPADVLLLLLLVGERVAAGAVPPAVAVAALVGIAVLGTTTLFLLARGPGRAMVDGLGPRIGITADRLDRATVLLERRGLP
jgi:membrane protein DedA with SNARE-associated domain